MLNTVFGVLRLPCSLCLVTNSLDFPCSERLDLRENYCLFSTSCNRTAAEVGSSPCFGLVSPRHFIGEMGCVGIAFSSLT